MERIVPHANTQVLVQGIRPSNLNAEERSRLNASAPIFKLPNEILLDIFMLMKEKKRNSQDFEDFHNITRICRHWREVAIEAPLLWTCIYTHRHKYSLMMLDRSCSAPLELHLQAREFHLDVAVTPFMEHVERVQRLACRVIPDTLKNAEAFLASFGRNALILEDLRIDVWTLGANDDRYTFSPTFFGAIRSSNHLHTLQLNGVLLDWRVFPVPRLAFLFLGTITTTAAVSGDAFTSALKGMPRLKQLSFNIDSLQLHQYPSSSHADPVYLSCLKSLTIQTLHPTGHAIYFLTHIALPAIQRLNVHCILVGTNDPGYDYNLHAPMIRAVGILIANGNFGTLQKLEFGWQSIAAFNASNRNEACVEVRMPVEAICNGERGFSQLASDVISYFTPINCPTLVELKLGLLSLTKDELLHTFGHLLHLKVIELPSELGIPFIEALCALGDNLPGTDIPFPNLECIHFIEGDPTHQTPFDDLAHCLTERRKRGAAIKKLRLSSYIDKPDDNIVKRLQDIMADVEVTVFEY